MVGIPVGCSSPARGCSSLAKGPAKTWRGADENLGTRRWAAATADSLSD